MLFDSPVFLAFLAVVVPVYWLLPHRQQNLLLLVASYVFYGWWDYRFLGLILISTVVDFYCARAIARSTDPGRRKVLLVISLAVNLTFLGFFKYYNFFADSFAQVLGAMHVDVAPRLLDILLPPGISFYTFQEVAYIVDVYFLRLTAAESLVDYALFITLFPHLIAGPIQRPSHLLPQVQQPRTFDNGKVLDGVLLILTGLFRKSVIADNCALLANAAFSGALGSPSIAVVALGTYAFAWQIYGDFSGYSDIARGSAQLMGFHFMVNFRQPYLSTTLQDFWRRWHISLSTWLRDYLYIPLGGNRKGEARTQGNLLTTMVIGGLWHGANWTFVFWGTLHGGWLAIERGIERVRARATGGAVRPAPGFAGRWLRRLFIFHLVCLAWIFFRAENMGVAAHFLGGLAHAGWRAEYATAVLFLAVFTLPLFAMDLVLERHDEEYPFARRPFPMKLAYAAAVVAALLLFSANSASAFIYFQF